jgi:hypothetical protein
MEKEIPVENRILIESRIPVLALASATTISAIVLVLAYGMSFFALIGLSLFFATLVFDHSGKNKQISFQQKYRFSCR